MKVIQRIWKGQNSEENTISLNENLLTETNSGQTRKAYRIAFQALPGTTFEILGENEENSLGEQSIDSRLDSSGTLIMGHTGIYELGFSRPIITSFKIISTVDEKSIMLFDALVLGDETPGQTRTITAQEFDYLENEYAGTNVSLNTSLTARWEGVNSNG